MILVQRDPPTDPKDQGQIAHFDAHHVGRPVWQYPFDRAYRIDDDLPRRLDVSTKSIAHAYVRCSPVLQGRKAAAAHLVCRVEGIFDLLSNSW